MDYLVNCLIAPDLRFVSLRPLYPDYDERSRSTPPSGTFPITGTLYAQIPYGIAVIIVDYFYHFLMVVFVARDPGRCRTPAETVDTSSPL